MKDWLSKGAQPTDSVARLLKAKNIAGVSRVARAARVSGAPARRRARTRCASRRSSEDGALVLRLHVATDDVGKVIGRQGRIARALRTVVRAGAVREDRRVLLEIVE